MKKFLILALASMLAACSSVKTSWDYDPQVNFKQFKSYAWVNKSDTDENYHLNGLMEQRVKNAVERELQAKGITPASNESADILVNYLTKVDKKVDVDTFNTDFGYNPYYRPGWNWGTRVHTQTTVREYEVGTLIVDIIDNHSKKLIWRGSLADTIRDNKSPEERTEIINQSVAQILANFPPQPKEK